MPRILPSHTAAPCVTRTRDLAPILVLTILLAQALHAADVPRPPYDPGHRVMAPMLFAEGLISSDADEGGGSFSPDGADFYFTVYAPYTTAPRFGMICVSHFRNGRWQRPESLPFSGKTLDFSPRVSADGNKLFFTSARPTPESKTPRYRIWLAEKSSTGWAEPKPLPEPINQETSYSLDPSVSADGTLYFTSDRGSETHHLHIFRSRLTDGKYQPPENLGPEINSNFTESSPAISPDGSVLVFASSSSPEDEALRRPQDLIADGKPYPRQDLYISVNRNGHWTPARHLEHGINSFAEETHPSFSPDGKYLFWGSERSSANIPSAPLTRTQVERLWRTPLNGRGNIYFISIDALEIEK
jgi:Tol biopolymer transport system component